MVIVKLNFINFYIIFFLIFKTDQNYQHTEARPLQKDKRSSSKFIEYCPELEKQTLKMILGPAYNPRYMSIIKPSKSSNSGGSTSSTNSGSKREYYEESFFVENSYENEISNQPAWEVDHIDESSSLSKSHRLRRSTKYLSDNPQDKNKNNDKNNFSDDIQQQQQQHPLLIRDSRRAFLDKIIPVRDNVFRGRPWECESVVTWIDLGYNYFPRYLRSIDCTRKECWYGHYTCKPKSFTVKVLKRHTGECAKINKKLKTFVSFDQITGDFTELWTWEEKAVNFCCDCVAR